MILATRTMIQASRVSSLGLVFVEIGVIYARLVRISPGLREEGC